MEGRAGDVRPRGKQTPSWKRKRRVLVGRPRSLSCASLAGSGWMWSLCHLEAERARNKPGQQQEGLLTLLARRMPHGLVGWMGMGLASTLTLFGGGVV